MEPKNKSTCGCFSFLRRKKSKPAKEELKSESLNPTEKIDSNFSHDRSLGLTEKLVPAQSIRSNIVTPNRAPHFQRLLPSVFWQRVSSGTKPKPLSTIEDSESQSAALKDLPIKPAIPNDNCLLKTSPVLPVSKPWDSNSQDAKAEENNPSTVNIQKSPEFLLSPGLSPDLFSNSNKIFNSPALASLEISPIKNIAVIEDNSDIVAILNNQEKTRSIPDVFLRNFRRPKQLPALKPFTPCYLAKRKMMPSTRNEL